MSLRKCIHVSREAIVCAPIVSFLQEIYRCLKGLGLRIEGVLIKIYTYRQGLRVLGFLKDVYIEFQGTYGVLEEVYTFISINLYMSEMFRGAERIGF